MFIAIVKINIKAMKFEEMTVTFHPNRPSIPIIITTEKKQLLIGTIIQINFRKTNHKVATINKKDLKNLPASDFLAYFHILLKDYQN